MGFLFGWAQLTVVLTGSIGAMAYAFADYGVRLWNLAPAATVWLAVAAIGLLTIGNVLGLVVGKSTQNVLSATKILGLLGVAVAGFFAGQGSVAMHSTSPVQGPGLGLAMVFVLLAYGGWNDAAFVASEVSDRRRNIPQALILGIAVITMVYLAANAAYLVVLGFDAARQSGTPASDVLERAVGNWGGRAVSILVMISALGAINGMILTGSRVYAAMGSDHRTVCWLGNWDHRRIAPVRALIAQACIAVLLVFAVGTVPGRNFIDNILTLARLPAVPWQQYFGGFETLVAGSAPVFWGFFLLSGLALFVLRLKDRGRERPFSAPWYPLPPIIFCATCGYMLYSSLVYAKSLALIGGGPLLVGILLYCFGQGQTTENPRDSCSQPAQSQNS